MRPKVHASYPTPCHETRSTCAVIREVIQRKWEVVQRGGGCCIRKEQSNDVDRNGSSRNESDDEGGEMIHTLNAKLMNV
jgi:hypothetical protein